MPSRDSTGKRIGGAEQRRQAAVRAAQARRPAGPGCPGGARGVPGGCPPPLDVQPPPDGLVADVVLWAQAVQAAAAAAAADPDQDERVRTVGQVAQQLAKLRGPAADSERAIRALALYRGQVVQTASSTPPAEPVGVSRWALAQLADVLHQAATAAEPDPDRLLHRAKALATVGLLLPQREIAQLTTELQREAG